MAKKEVIYQGLSDLNVLIDDTTQYSPDYFRVTNLPGEFTAGINIFKFKGNPALFPENSPVFIEVLDANGLPVYYEIGLDLESQEQTAIISVYINEDTVPGNGSVTICGQANQSSSGQILDASEINVRWSVPVYIDISKRNVDDIIFDELPVVTITATTGSYINLGYPSNTRTESDTWSNISYIYRNGEATLYTSSLSFPAFPSTATNTTVTLYYGDIADVNQRTNEEIYTTAEFTSSISSYSGSGIAYLADPIIFAVNNSSEQHIVQSGVINTMDVVYEQSASLASQSTENTHNIAIVQFSGLQPQVGEISKIRSYYKSAGVQEYIFSNETDISDLADEFGFTANTVTASFALPTIHRNDRFDFKFEFVNPSGYVSKQVLEYRDVLFLGGNTYIGGEDNLITGSLYVAGATGTGVHISGKGSAAMIRSIGYEGFAKAVAGTGAGGFVIYSGSVQPLLNASEQYAGVGIELFANTASYFKYTTSGSGLLDIRTDQFFLGSGNQYISGSGGNIVISSSNFSINQGGNTTMQGDVIANNGIFKNVNIIGQIASGSTNSGGNNTIYLMEPWITGSSNITSTKLGNIVKLPLTFTNASSPAYGSPFYQYGVPYNCFKIGSYMWSGSCVGYTYDFETGTSTPYNALSFASASNAVTASGYTTKASASITFDSSIGRLNRSGIPTTFRNWGAIAGYEGHEYNRDVNGNYLSASIDSIIFPIFPTALDPTYGQPYTLSIFSEIISIEEIDQTSAAPLSLQFQAKFINNTSDWLYSSGAPTGTDIQIMYDCKFKVEIYNGNNTLILEDVKLQESETGWLDFNIPLTAALLNNPTYNPGGLFSMPFYEVNKLRIKLSWQVLKHRAPSGHDVGTDPKQVRITELRIAKLPTSIGLTATAIKFSDSYLASGTNSTLVQGNLIPVEDITYDLGSSAQNPQSDYSGYQTVGGQAQKRWNNIYGKFLSADSGISVGSSFVLQATGSVASGYKSIAAGEYSHAEGAETITGRKIIVNGGSDGNVYNFPISAGDYYATYIDLSGPGANITSSITTGTADILTIGNGPSYYNTDPYIQKDIVTCTQARFVSASYGPGFAYATVFHLEYVDADGLSQPYTDDIVYLVQLNSSSGTGAHSEGQYTSAYGATSHAEGYDTQAAGDFSHAEGYQTLAQGESSHAEGITTFAIGTAAHAEGYLTYARGDRSHAEGEGAQTSASYAHAEGSNTRANGEASHAEGRWTEAWGNYQHVQGTYNMTSSVQSAFIIGNGTSAGNRRNLVFGAGTEFQVTGSLLVTGSAVITGSLRVQSGITGSLFGTASWATNAISTPNAFTLGGSPFVGYVPYANGNLTFTNSGIYYSSTNIGIGTTSPASKLDVSINDNAYATAFTVSNSNAGSQALSQITLQTANNSSKPFQIRQFNSGGAVELANYANSLMNFWTSGSVRLTITNGGAMGLGGITPTNTLGRFEASNDIVAYSSSDKNWKTNIKNINSPLEKISQINGVEFDWIEDEPVHGNKGHDVGVIAQEIEQILPEIVQTRESGMKAVQYDKMIPLLVECIKDQQKQIEELKQIINGITR